MPRIPSRSAPHEGSKYPSQIVAQRARDARRLHDDLSQENVAERMVSLGHPTWKRQTVGQIETAERNLTVDELVSLAAALETAVSYLLSPASVSDPYTAQPVDVGGPEPLDRNQLLSLYGFTTMPHPQAYAYYEWSDMTFKVARNWEEVKWEGAGDEGSQA